MRYIADAIVTGFAKSPVLIERSLAPLRTLRQEGLLRSIHYVTWDSPELDAYVAPIADMPDVEISRVAQPRVSGEPDQRNLAFQVANLDAALAKVPEDGTVVLKSRPDFVAKVDYLRERVVRFPIDQKMPEETPFGIKMPERAFRNKIWVPWADSNQPFFYEDAAFMGRKADLLKLVTPLTAEDFRIAGQPSCRHYVHIVRFAKVFLDAYPLFRRYLQNHHLYTNDTAYRVAFIRHTAEETFYWFLLVAHAWILHSHFHVECGEQDDILFYAGHVNKKTDWSKPATWVNANPYEDVEGWRKGQNVGKMTLSNYRPFGRLMDNGWQSAIFDQELPDFPRETLQGLLQHIPHVGDGRLNDMEEAFYQNIARFQRQHTYSVLESQLAKLPRGVLDRAGAGSSRRNAVADLSLATGLRP